DVADVDASLNAVAGQCVNAGNGPRQVLRRRYAEKVDQLGADERHRPRRFEQRLAESERRLARLVGQHSARIGRDGDPGEGRHVVPCFLSERRRNARKREQNCGRQGTSAMHHVDSWISVSRSHTRVLPIPTYWSSYGFIDETGDSPPTRSPASFGRETFTRGS